MTTLTQLDRIPEGLLATPATALHRVLSGPTLLRLQGRRDPPLFVSMLLHGNETSGWEALRQVLAQLPELPRSLRVFIGNVAAAASGLRTLPNQTDYNRIWHNHDGVEAAMATELAAAALGERLFGAVDLHNNTGHNPHYSVLTRLSPPNLALALEFSDKAVYIEEPDTVLTRIFDAHCPALALELGPVGDIMSDERAADFLHRCLRLERIEAAASNALQLFRTVARVHVREGVRFAFDGDGRQAPLTLTGGVEAVNFHALAPGTELGMHEGVEQPLRILDDDHRDVTDRFIVDDGRRLTLRMGVVPAMYTTDPLVVRQDCLCYFMEPIAHRES